MTATAQRPLLFLDVDGPLIPFGGTARQFPDGYPNYPIHSTSTHRTGRDNEAPGNPLLARINPTLGRQLHALPYDLVWATTWLDDANTCVSPQLGLPQLPFTGSSSLPLFVFGAGSVIAGVIALRYARRVPAAS